MVDYAAGQIVAGWVRGPTLADVTVTASIDGTLIAGACAHDAEYEDMLTFSISLPRSISAGELASGRLIVEARNTAQSVALPCSQPVEAAAVLDNMTAEMIGRMVAFLSSESAEALTAALSGPSIALPTSKGKGIDPEVLEDLMRWS